MRRDFEAPATIFCRLRQAVRGERLWHLAMITEQTLPLIRRRYTTFDSYEKKSQNYQVSERLVYTTYSIIINKQWGTTRIFFPRNFSEVAPLVNKILPSILWKNELIYKKEIDYATYLKILFTRFFFHFLAFCNWFLVEYCNLTKLNLFSKNWKKKTKNKLLIAKLAARGT